MSVGIPSSFAAVLKAVDTICAEFNAGEAFSPFGPQRWIRDINVEDDDVQHVAFLLDADAPLLAVYVVLRVPGASARAASLAKATARANYGLLPGAFEIDLESAEMRYRAALVLFSDQVTARDVAGLLSGALLTARTYAPAFQKIARSDADPLEAIDEVESE